MLGKLLKHEFRATSRTFVPLLGLFLLFSIAVRLLTYELDSISSSTLGVVLTVIVCIIYGACFVAVLAFGGFSSIIRFNKNIFTDEGYLMNTLPIKPHLHIFTKLISSVVWVIVSIIACSISVCILSFGIDMFSKIGKFLAELISAFGEAFMESPLLSVLLLLFIMVMFIMNYLVFFSAIAIGSSSTTKKGVFQVISFIAITVVISIIFFNSSEMVVNFLDFTDIMTDFDAAIMSDNTTLINEISYELVDALNVFLLILSSVCAAISVGLFFLTNFFMTKKLNLE